MPAADGGYGENSQFRSAPDKRGIGYIMQVKDDALAHKPDVRPVERVWSGRGPRPAPTLPARSDIGSIVSGRGATHGRSGQRQDSSVQRELGEINRSLIWPLPRGCRQAACVR
ncbi:transposase [Micromonospora sp. CB01531]|uniref:transposase n=1 Tax=Micromonospora sp. CB01531 TaxID=1718947 RepID=UPI001F52A005|nr:transposase [Micromonospora sp. CB01531]